MTEKTTNRSAVLLAAKRQTVESTTIWLLFIFFGWSFGSMNKVGLQILYYLTLGGFGIWFLIRLFTLSGAIKDYNTKVCMRFGLTPEEMLQLGIY